MPEPTSVARPSREAYPTVHGPCPGPEPCAATRRILDAAQALFLERGYQRTTIERIARAARASKATVYEHFPSKEELFLAVAVHAMESLHREIEPALLAEGPDAARPEDAVDAWLHLMPAAVEACPVFFELWALLPKASSIRERCLELFRAAYRRFARTMARVIERDCPGAYRAGEAEAYALGLLAALDGLCYQWLFIGDRVLLARTATAIREGWLRGLRRPPAAGAEGGPGEEGR